MKFQGSQNYVATQDLMLAVNAAITLKRPLLVKGEPGTGKTMLAEEVAAALNMPLLQWHIKSTTKAQQGLYEYDAVSRLRDSQMADLDGGERVKNIENYIIKGVLWQAFTAKEPVALLIDEIDKADIEFPNDLLRELDRMEFYCYETRELIKATTRSSHWPLNGSIDTPNTTWCCKTKKPRCLQSLTTAQAILFYICPCIYRSASNVLSTSPKAFAKRLNYSRPNEMICMMPTTR